MDNSSDLHGCYKFRNSKSNSSYPEAYPNESDNYPTQQFYQPQNYFLPISSSSSWYSAGADFSSGTGCSSSCESGVHFYPPDFLQLPAEPAVAYRAAEEKKKRKKQPRDETPTDEVNLGLSVDNTSSSSCGSNDLNNSKCPREALQTQSPVSAPFRWMQIKRHQPKPAAASAQSEHFLQISHSMTEVK
ncbi:hypothetical protein Ciccas_013733 [Cichlidogyrus casuarinus]|uniref:Uncharacterized protein n=1 Tax=Cichlidogyrus casuarinus TaxID=1844966 RepID=A0ABD2PLM7_9PLAT